MSQQPYHIYLDLDVLNNIVASGAKPQQLVFEETRNTPFLDGDASEYLLHNKILHSDRVEFTCVYTSYGHLTDG